MGPELEIIWGVKTVGGIGLFVFSLGVIWASVYDPFIEEVVVNRWRALFALFGIGLGGFGLWHFITGCGSIVEQIG